MNGVAPEQATSRRCARLSRPAPPGDASLPALALKAIFSQAATVLLASQRVALAPRSASSLDFPT